MDVKELVFHPGTHRACHTITITAKRRCENPLYFFANLKYVNGTLPITIDPPKTRVIIDSTNETECGQLVTTTDGEMELFFMQCAAIPADLETVAIATGSTLHTRFSLLLP